jgi:hypothetical protein
LFSLLFSFRSLTQQAIELTAQTQNELFSLCSVSARFLLNFCSLSSQETFQGWNSSLDLHQPFYDQLAKGNACAPFMGGRGGTL